MRNASQRGPGTATPVARLGRRAVPKDTGGPASRG